MKTRKINVLSYAGLNAIIMSLVGLLAGILYSVGGFFIDLFVSLGWIITSETPGLSYGTALAFLALIGMPILFGLFGFVFSLIGGIVYNLFAKTLDIDLNIKQNN